MRNAKAEDVLYTEAELKSCMDKIELVDYHTTTVTVGAFSLHGLTSVDGLYFIQVIIVWKIIDI
jgi:hypothetical protein